MNNLDQSINDNCDKNINVAWAYMKFMRIRNIQAYNEAFDKAKSYVEEIAEKIGDDHLALYAAMPLFAKAARLTSYTEKHASTFEHHLLILIEKIISDMREIFSQRTDADYINDKARQAAKQIMEETSTIKNAQNVLKVLEEAKNDPTQQHNIDGEVEGVIMVLRGYLGCYTKP